MISLGCDGIQTGGAGAVLPEIRGASDEKK